MHTVVVTTSGCKYEPCHLQKYFNGYAMAGGNREGQESGYRELLQNFMEWIESMNITKSKELVVNFKEL